MMSLRLFEVLFLTLLLHASLICAQSESRNDMDEEMRRIARENGIDPDNPAPGTIMLTPPKLSNEEEGSQFMPKAHRCDGCTAVAYQLTKHFAAAEKKKKKNEALSEAEILGVTESVCDGEYKEYGLKNVQGMNLLSGEGLDANKMSGMVETGGKWVKRLQNICKEIMGEHEEETVYSFYQTKDTPLKTFICPAYCSNTHQLKDEF